ncbi:hypothetical protein KSF73_17250 [Burkholderiaceae bacterium DAT-1]|nr:hypothetical protein [Burkholderiaceae bacterium DAT-1]
MTNDSAQELRRAATLRQGIRRVAACAFTVNTLGINAILTAKRYGDHARGFGIISSELRHFSKALLVEMQVLTDLGMQLIREESNLLKRHRCMELLIRTEQASPHSGLQAVIQTLKSDDSLKMIELNKVNKQMHIALGNAFEICLFGSVIARSARIESAHANTQGDALTDAANDFAKQVDSILLSLETLKRALRINK